MTLDQFLKKESNYIMAAAHPEDEQFVLYFGMKWEYQTVQAAVVYYEMDGKACKRNYYGAVKTSEKYWCAFDEEGRIVISDKGRWISGGFGNDKAKIFVLIVMEDQAVTVFYDPEKMSAACIMATENESQKGPFIATMMQYILRCLRTDALKKTEEKKEEHFDRGGIFDGKES